MLPTPARDYLLAALDNTPTTVIALLSSFPTDAPTWNVRPYPERFSLREIVAHLADWEEVFRERFERTVREDFPRLTRPDLDQRSEEQGYDHADPQECLARFRKQRTQSLDWLRTLSPEEWSRGAHLDRIGDLNLEGLATLMAGHDSYHLRQIAEWLSF